jgi:hypothetical protein
MKVRRTLRRLDDLAEVFIFDVALATPARRLCCFLLAAGLTFAAYMTSGLIFPGKITPHAPQDSTPYLPNHLASDRFASALEATVDVVAALKVEPMEAEPIALELKPHQALLDAAVALAQNEILVPFNGSPDMQKVHQLCTLLAVRGSLLVEQEQPDAAVADWLAIGRIGRALGQRPGLDAVAAAATLERWSFRFLQHFAESGQMSLVQAATVREALERRRGEVTAFGTLVEREAGRIVEEVRRVAREGALADHPNWEALRLWLPARRGARAAALEQLADRLESYLQGLVRELRAGRSVAPPRGLHAVRFLFWTVPVPEALTWTQLVAGGMDTASGFTRALELLMTTETPNMMAAQIRWMSKEREAARLQEVCEAIR